MKFAFGSALQRSQNVCHFAREETRFCFPVVDLENHTKGDTVFLLFTSRFPFSCFGNEEKTARERDRKMSGEAASAIIGLIVLLIVLYFVIGTFVRYRKGLRQFPEALPNYHFWRRVALSIKTGFLRLVSCGKYQAPTSQDSAVLPTRPRRDYGFEELPDEADEFDEEIENDAVVVRY